MKAVTAGADLGSVIFLYTHRHTYTLRRESQSLGFGVSASDQVFQRSRDYALWHIRYKKRHIEDCSMLPLERPGPVAVFILSRECLEALKTRQGSIPECHKYHQELQPGDEIVSKGAHRNTGTLHVKYYHTSCWQQLEL